MPERTCTSPACEDGRERIYSGLGSVMLDRPCPYCAKTRELREQIAARTARIADRLAFGGAPEVGQEIAVGD